MNIENLFEKEIVIEMFGEMKDFISEIRLYLNIS